MKFAYSSSMFRLRSLAEAIESIARAGFQAVELMADRPHAFPEDLGAPQITALNDCLKERKMKIGNLNCCMVSALGEGHRPSWIEEDWEEREKRIRYTLDCLRLAAALGLPHVTIGPGGPVPSTMNQGEAFRLLVANMHRVLPAAERLGVKVLVQVEPGWLVETSVQLLNFLKALDFHDRLGVNFVPAHFFCLGEDPGEALERLAPYVGHVQLSDSPDGRVHRHVQLGEGAMDVEDILKKLEAAGYGGLVTVKLETYEQRADEMVRGSARYLVEHGFMKGEKGDGQGETASPPSPA